MLLKLLCFAKKSGRRGETQIHTTAGSLPNGKSSEINALLFHDLEAGEKRGRACGGDGDRVEVGRGRISGDDAGRGIDDVTAPEGEVV